ncbi:MAG: hypothetical protein Q4G22_07855 [Paracoccus sp. (in: a-proteobacteria)]|uniref:hypothetical protein n=1 Tax=Paracoccus sp. TaxID=267 RepID=UPI0026DF840F|nr:hypothetical protein [Paracoccus sp. (in: a-proteobacteria)]MDO5631737.1 hypothetical protein [Paracoccus sp. (in: a-proteobacteria)]
MLADPSLNQHDKLRIGWYAGNSNFAAQRLISVFCQQATQVLKVDRAIYFGSSAGGFPALLYSWHHAGSLALVSNAHTNIANYYSGHVSDYVALCWPGHDDVRDLPGTVTDLRTLYGKQVPNNVVFIQNNTDTFHLFNHAIPFLGAITNHDDRAKITTEMVYPGKTGHGPVWSAIAPWLMAALTAPSWSAIDLIETRHRLSQKASPAPATAAPKQHMAAGFAPADLELAALLRNAQLPPLPKGAQ